MISKLDAILSLVPNAEVTLVGDEITEWHSEDITQPTDAEITTEQARLQAEYDGNQYQRDRLAEYPSYGEQLDYIFHHGLDAWKADIIQPIKDQFPKP